ncbi:MAG TPA: ABC transporter permease [Candidatus Limnocylindrales bacterium]|nr:ABC transporter permease [Candidatus Limnocylindrales bacterium]
MSGLPSAPGRHEPAFPNTTHVARREYLELVRSRLFHVSTVTLAVLAILVALLPIVARLAERGTVTQVAIVSSDADLSERTIGTLDLLLNQNGTSRSGGYKLTALTNETDAIAGIDARRYDAYLVAARSPDGHLSFQFHLGETAGDAVVQQLSIGVFGVAVLDFSDRNSASGFRLPQLDVLRQSGEGGGAAPYSASNSASRLVVGLVFGILIFITIVIYGMWVAAGVVAEKSSRVMELLVSAASPRQLVIGKALGIGLAGGTQYLLVLAPAIATLLLEDRIASAVLGAGAGIALSLEALSPTLLIAFFVFYTLGFALYALVYAAAGSLVSRPEDLQIIALPLSLIAIVGYLQAILALTGGITGFIRFASYVPFWSPFVMLTRLSVGRVEPIELLISIALLLATIVVTGIVAIRIYSAGVLLYGQRPGLRAYVAAARHG